MRTLPILLPLRRWLEEGQQLLRNWGWRAERKENAHVTDSPSSQSVAGGRATIIEELGGRAERKDNPHVTDSPSSPSVAGGRARIREEFGRRAERKENAHVTDSPSSSPVAGGRATIMEELWGGPRGRRMRTLPILLPLRRWPEEGQQL